MAQILLEPGQLVRDAACPLARAELRPGTRAALWVLRLLTLALAAMVVTTFVIQVG